MVAGYEVTAQHKSGAFYDWVRRYYFPKIREQKDAEITIHLTATTVVLVVTETPENLLDK